MVGNNDCDNRYSALESGLAMNKSFPVPKAKFGTNFACTKPLKMYAFQF